ncbi:hypothetical protein conserved [Leishmania donovani]|uniref:Hypothetical_protein_conserved n=1 Tax=Leishmania donovani TaxID=5661 RepID=A0A6J8FC22_LEIDO|nr:hypothetical protein conserved [Leishmania donovani]VDZ43709.1 hypothetical_protein_conserved [Leishmania donovani]
MGQAASYAESSVQRALLRLKEEEQADEDELLCACGYRRASLASSTEESAAVAARSSRDAEQSGSSPLSATRSADVQLPPPPESLGPLVSLTPEYYTLDELRHVLQYLPDPLWVSLYRVSLLYMLDNDRDGRINSTDISFFMDWGIKTVGRDVQPDQLAEVLQTYAALHCWHCCLHVGERIEAIKAAAAAQPHPGHGGNTGAGGAVRTRRHHILSPSAVGPLPLHQHHEQHHSQSVPSFMLFHFREAFLNAPAGGPVPLPGKMDITATKSSESTVSPTQSPPSLASSPSVFSQSITDNVRHAAAAHFAEWMLRLVQHQERDRRHERQRFERRVRSMATASDVRLGATARLRHSSYVAQQSLRLRLSATLLPTEAASADPSADGDDLVVSVSRNSTPGQHRSMPCATLSADAGAVAALWDVEDGAPELEVVAPAPSPQLATSLPFSKSPTVTPKSRPPYSHSTPATSLTCVKTPPQPSSPSSSVTPLSVPIALGGGNGSPKGNSSPLLSSAIGTPPTSAGSLPDGRRRTAVGGALITNTSPPHQPSRQHPSAVALTTRWKSLGGPPYAACLNTAVSPEDLAAGTSASANGAGATEGDLNGSDFSNVNGWVSASSIASATGAGGAAAAATAPSGGSAASLLAHQVSVLLMDAEVFYAELEANGWCTIGAVEEVYLDFAVEESYCLPFWSFCRLLNKASADEVQAALELPTDQAVAVLTSAVAVEEYRRAAAVRQLQRHATMQRDGGHGNGNHCYSSSRGDGWARNLQVIPMFVVSEYTFVAFVAAFIHAYWAMLASMGVDPVT